jgi:hypothetical protein
MKDFLKFIKTPIGKFFAAWAIISIAVVGYGLWI